MKLMNLAENFFKNKSKTTSVPLQKSVYLIDDDPIILATIKEFVQQWGFQVITYDDPQRAFFDLKMIANPSHILCIISDVMMDNGDGIDFLKKVKRNTRLSDTPFIFISGVDDTFISQFVENHDNVQFLKKPVPLHDLKMLIDNLKEGRR